jgi:hypothetical protein
LNWVQRWEPFCRISVVPEDLEDAVIRAIVRECPEIHVFVNWDVLVDGPSACRFQWNTSTSCLQTFCFMPQDINLVVRV